MMAGTTNAAMPLSTRSSPTALGTPQQKDDAAHDKRRGDEDVHELRHLDVALAQLPGEHGDIQVNHDPHQGQERPAPHAQILRSAAQRVQRVGRSSAQRLNPEVGPLCLRPTWCQSRQVISTFA